MNRDLFNGQSVVRRQGNSLIINTEMLNMTAQFNTQNVIVATVSPVYESSTEAQAHVFIVPVDSTNLTRSESNVPIATATVVH